MSASLKPLLLLDVDGTLCPFIRAGAPRPPHLVDLGPRLLCDPRTTDWLEVLGQHFDMIWASLWEEDCNRVVGPLLGLSTLPVIPFHKVTADITGMRAEKLLDVALWLDINGHGERPLAWIDDDLSDDDLAWGHERNALTPTLMRRCRPSEGLLPEHVTELLDFAGALSLPESSR